MEFVGKDSLRKLFVFFTSLVLVIFGSAIAALGLVAWAVSGGGGYSRSGQPLDEELYFRLGRASYEALGIISTLGGLAFAGIALVGVLFASLGVTRMKALAHSPKQKVNSSKCVPCLRTFDLLPGENCPLCGAPLETTKQL